MIRALAISLAAASTATLVMVSAAAAQSYTTRIEPRPFYGAVVTLEEGVRVIRPLPPERHVIINPDHGTALTLGFNETRVYENRVIRNYNLNANGGGRTTYGRVIYGTNGAYGAGYGGYGYMHLGVGGVTTGRSGH